MTTSSSSRVSCCVVLLLACAAPAMAQAQQQWKAPSFYKGLEGPQFTVLKTLGDGVELRRYEPGAWVWCNRQRVSGCRMGWSRVTLRCNSFPKSLLRLPVVLHTPHTNTRRHVGERQGDRHGQGDSDAGVLHEALQLHLWSQLTFCEDRDDRAGYDKNRAREGPKL